MAAKDYIEMYNQLKRIIDWMDDNIIVIEDDKINSHGGHLCYRLPNGEMIPFSNANEYTNARKQELEMLLEIIHFKEFKVMPVSIDGSEYGKPIDRYYIEKFLSKKEQYITGTVLEVQDDRYTKMFGREKVDKSLICHVAGWNGAVQINFENGFGVIENMADCIICTQTLQYIFDARTAVMNIYKMLKPGGNAFITVPGIKPISEFHNKQWGEYWSFTENSIKRICESFLSPEQFFISVYGNVKSSMAFLYGVCAEELECEELDYLDERYPMIIGVAIVKG